MQISYPDSKFSNNFVASHWCLYYSYYRRVFNNDEYRSNQAASMETFHRIQKVSIRILRRDRGIGAFTRRNIFAIFYATSTRSWDARSVSLPSDNDFSWPEGRFVDHDREGGTAGGGDEVSRFAIVVILALILHQVRHNLLLWEIKFCLNKII